MTTSRLDNEIQLLLRAEFQHEVPAAQNAAEERNPQPLRSIIDDICEHDAWTPCPRCNVGYYDFVVEEND